MNEYTAQNIRTTEKYTIQNISNTTTEQSPNDDSTIRTFGIIFGVIGGIAILCGCGFYCSRQSSSVFPTDVTQEEAECCLNGMFCCILGDHSRNS